jgi:flavonol synthase
VHPLSKITQQSTAFSILYIYHSYQIQDISLRVIEGGYLSSAMEVQSVQAIAFSSLTTNTIPAEFIRPEKEQPALTTFHGPAPEIPTVDLSDPDQDKLVRLIANASKEWGIFQVVNHGIPSDVVSNLQAVGKHFFELPQEEKEAYAKPCGAQSVEGYGNKLQKDPDGKKAWVDHLFHMIWPPSVVNYRFWPKNPPSYRSILLVMYLI